LNRQDAEKDKNNNQTAKAAKDAKETKS